MPNQNASAVLPLSGVQNRGASAFGFGKPETEKRSRAWN